MKPRHLLLVLSLPLSVHAVSPSPASPTQNETPAKNEQDGGFLDAANKKTAEIKKALDKLAGNDLPSTPNNAPGEWKGKLSLSKPSQAEYATSVALSCDVISSRSSSELHQPNER